MWIGWQSKAGVLTIQSLVAEAGYQNMECLLSGGESELYKGVEPNPSITHTAYIPSVVGIRAHVTKKTAG